jgi:hypothetical protein
MDSRTCLRKLRGPIAALLACALALPLHARVATLEVERIGSALGRIDALSLRVAWPDAAESGELTLALGALDASELGYRFRDVKWNCELQRVAPDHYGCKGKVDARGQGSATLEADWNAGELRLALSQGRGEFALLVPSAPDAATRLKAIRLPLAWLQPLLAPRWKEARLTAGTLDSTLEFRSVAGKGTEINGPVAVAGLGLDTADGRIAAAALDADGRVDFDLLEDATAIALDLTLHGGEVLLGPLYANLPESAIELGLALRSQPDGAWAIERFGWKDPGVLDLQGHGVIDTGAASSLRALDATLALPALQLAHPRYLDTLLGTLGLAKLELKGALRAQLAWRDGRAVDIDLDAAAIDARDGEQRFAVTGLDGRLHWTAADAVVDSDLRWHAARLYDVALGAVDLALQSSARGLRLRAPATLPMLGGSLRLPRFAWQPPQEGRAGTQLDLALELERIDMAQLGRALAWPEFPGTLSGRIPAVRYADEVLLFDGGLGVDVFDGRVEIAQMTLERPFGVAPTMTADIAFAGLDLEPLTGAFGFGEITGRLDGQVRALRLVDWSPVAFDADLHTSTTAKGPRRISRAAVDDLSRVGGAGVVAGLQNQVLKLFDTFGYARIGLRCTLAGNVCRMDGVDSSGDGYTIVEGSGLPRITVIGHQRQVDWPVLVARLQAATAGQAPIIE